jgi:condensin-2 complex subunit H2
MATAGEDNGDEDLRENRFAYLLQPIRDLAANWDIDIAAELEEYLEELEGITFAIEDCGPSLNFAEAALLIQVRAAGVKRDSSAARRSCWCSSA